jgi:thermitase
MQHRHASVSLVLASLLATGCGHTAPAGTLSMHTVIPKVVQAKTSGVTPEVTLVHNTATPAGASLATEVVTLTSAPAGSTTEPAVPNEMIVHFKGAARELPGASLKGAMGLNHTFVYKLKPNAYSVQAVDDWESAQDVDYVEPNFIYHATALPNDPDFGASWGIAAINAPDVWGITQGEGVTIAVVDTGVALNNPDLQGQLLPGLDLVNHTDNPNDDHGHGTHVAGTIAAIANNGFGVAGVAPHAKILPIKVLDSSGSGTNETIANGILEAARRGAQVINLSLGGTDDSQTLRRAIAQVEAQGVVVVCAAGNDGSSAPFYPAACDGAIGVGALDRSNRKASFSNYGNYVSIAAPGVSIGSLGYLGGLSTESGTSMAAPHVAGTAALLLSAFPQLKARNILKAMQRGGQLTQGFNQATPPVALNAEGALTAVATLDLQPPTQVSGLTGVPGAPGEVRLAWQSASDNVGVVGYRVLRDGTPVGTSATPSFADVGVNTSASYIVTAYDADGNESAPSAPLTVQAGAASSEIFGLRASERGTDHLTISWQTTRPMRCSLNIGTNAQLGTATPTETVATIEHSMRLQGLQRFHSYSFQATATDDQGHSFYSDIKHARTKIWWLFGF